MTLVIKFAFRSDLLVAAALLESALPVSGQRRSLVLGWELQAWALEQLHTLKTAPARVEVYKGLRLLTSQPGSLAQAWAAAASDPLVTRG